MYKDYRFIKAGENEFYRWGKKAQEKMASFLEPRNGFYSLPVDGLKYYTVGTSDGKYGEYAKFGDTFFSVNRAGFMWAKEGTEKADKFIEAINAWIEEMKNFGKRDDSEDEEVEED